MVGIAFIQNKEPIIIPKPCISRFQLVNNFQILLIWQSEEQKLFLEETHLNRKRIATRMKNFSIVNKLLLVFGAHLALNSTLVASSQHHKFDSPN